MPRAQVTAFLALFIDSVLEWEEMLSEDHWDTRLLVLAHLFCKQDEHNFCHNSTAKKTDIGLEGWVPYACL